MQKCKEDISYCDIDILRGGIFGWKIWEPIALIACVIIAAIQLLNLIENQIVTSDDELIKIGELRAQYLKYFNKLEKLWTDFEAGTVTDEDASSQFFSLRTGLKEKIEKMDNELHIKQIESLLMKTDKQEKFYFKNRYGKGAVNQPDKLLVNQLGQHLRQQQEE